MDSKADEGSSLRKFAKKSCCNPFKSHSKKIVRGLRNVTERTMTLHPSLHFQSGDQLCPNCRIKITALPIPEEEATQSTNSQSTNSSESGDVCQPGTSGMKASASKISHDTFESPDHQLVQLNTSLQVLGESPVVKRKIDTRVHYAKKKVKSIHTTVKRKLELITGEPLDESDEEPNDPGASEIIDQLKEKFKSCSKRSEKVQVLTVLPKSWSMKRIETEFEATNYMVRKAKKLVEDKGILSTPNQKAGRTLPASVVDNVRAFYCSDSTSRLMPGMKDYVSVNVDGQRQKIQKRLVLCNLKEAFEQFKETFPEHKIGFSKFAELRPKECVLAGASGTHAVCVCTIHQNIKLMFQGAKLETMCKGYTYRNCLAEIQCNPSRVQCFLGRCNECPGIESVRSRIELYFDERMTDRIEFKKWTTTDRATLETKIQSVDEFLGEFLGVLPTVLLHDFIAKQQSQFLQSTKSQLEPGEFLVVGDFAENYSFVLQDAAQSFHWNNLQATLHPFVCYYTDDTAQNDEAAQRKKISHVSFVVISECNTHDTVAVHLFQKVLIEFLTKKIEKPKKVIYFSDGCAAQYKNRKNFINLCHHREDFGMPAEWHFFATSHGKGPCDGIGGTVKRLAARASLQRPYNKQILTPRQLFEFGCSEIPTVNFHYTTIEEHENESALLKERFESTRTIAGTHRLHSFRPISTKELEVRDFSTSDDKRIERVAAVKGNSDTAIKFAAIRGYVTAQYDGMWWLGCITKSLQDSEEVEVTFLHPHGPAKSFKYPPSNDVLVMSYHDILTLVNPSTTTGRVYTLSQAEMAAASATLDKSAETLK